MIDDNDRIVPLRLEHYRAVCTRITFDKRISASAKALWFTVMTLPSDWDFNGKGLMTLLSLSTYAYRRAVKELETFGYVKRTQERSPEDPRRFGGVTLEFKQEPESDSRGTRSRYAEPRHAEDSQQYNKNHDSSLSLHSSEKEKNHDITASPSQETQTKKVRQKKSETPLPEDFELTPAMREWAAKKVPTLDIEDAFERFKDTARSKNWRYADWVAHWRNCMRNLVKWAAEDAKRKNLPVPGFKASYQGRALGEVR